MLPGATKTRFRTPLRVAAVISGSAILVGLVSLVGCRTDLDDPWLKAGASPWPDLSPPPDATPPPSFDSGPPPPDIPSPPALDSGPPSPDLPPSFDSGPPSPDLSRPPVDLASPSDRPPPIDAPPPGDLPPPLDRGWPSADSAPTPDLASSCLPGRYRGPLTGAMAGVPVDGTFDFTLGPPQNGILPVVAGTMTAKAVILNITITFDAALGGSLDCGRGLLEGTIHDGFIRFQNQASPYAGTFDAVYSAGKFVKGTWLITAPNTPFGRLVGNGTWFSN